MRTLKLLPLLLLAFAPQLHAALVTYNLVVTNAAVTGDSYDIYGVTRRWTNATTATTIQTNLSSARHTATNWFNQLSLNRPATFILLTRTSPTNFTIRGEGLSISIAGNWATASSTTAATTNRENFALPFSVHTPTNQTNYASEIARGIGLYSTSAIPATATALSNVIGRTLSATQVVTGPIRFTGTNTLTNSSWRGGTIAEVSGLSGEVGALTNGYFEAPVMFGATITNLSAPGTGLGSQRIGAGSQANGIYSLAFGNFSIASGPYSIAQGDGAIVAVTGTNSFAFGKGAYTQEPDSGAFGAFSVNMYRNSVAAGPYAETTASNQWRIGTASQHVSIPGELRAATSTNNNFTGTNNQRGDWATPARIFTTLGVGNNISVNFGTNELIHLNGGLTNTASICGVVLGRDGLGYELVNKESFNVTLAVNTIDPVPANRFGMAADVVIIPTGRALIQYDVTALRWYVAGLYPMTATATNVILGTTNLTDVASTYSGLADGQVLTWDATSGRWTNRVAAAGGSGWTIGQTNVTVTSSNTANVPLIVQPLTGTLTNAFQVNGTNGAARMTVDKDGQVNAYLKYGFAASPNDAIYTGGNQLLLTVGGTDRLLISGNGFNVGGIPLALGSSIYASDVMLYPDSPGALGQRNGTTPQTNSLYKTTDGGANFSRLKFCYDVTKGAYSIRKEEGGTGISADPIQFSAHPAWTNLALLTNGNIIAGNSLTAIGSITTSNSFFVQPKTGLTGPSIQANTTNGQTAFRVSSTSEAVYMAGVTNVTSPTVATGDATPTTIYSITLDTGATYVIEATIMAYPDSVADRAAYQVVGAFYDNAGTATLLGTLSTPLPASETAGATTWNATLDVSGSDVRVRVTGAAAVSLDWKANIRIHKNPL